MILHIANELSYIATLFGCSRSTIYVGILDLENNDSTTTDRVRKPGGGRKSIYDTIPNIEDEILESLQENTAGSPTSECKWTNLHPREIAEYLALEGIFVSHTTIRKTMNKNESLILI